MTTSNRLLALAASPLAPTKAEWANLRERFQDILWDVPVAAGPRLRAVEQHLASITWKPTSAEWSALLRDLDFLRIWMEGYETAAPRRRSEDEPGMLRVREYLSEWVAMFSGSEPAFLQDVLDAHVNTSQDALRLVNLRIDNYVLWLNGVRPTAPLDIRMGMPEDDYRELRLAARRKE
jgi:hypothetical protein